LQGIATGEMLEAPACILIRIAIVKWRQIADSQLITFGAAESISESEGFSLEGCGGLPAKE
jgi:hypothetical protein